MIVAVCGLPEHYIKIIVYYIIYNITAKSFVRLWMTSLVLPQQVKTRNGGYLGLSRSPARAGDPHSLDETDEK